MAKIIAHITKQNFDGNHHKIVITVTGKDKGLVQNVVIASDDGKTDDCTLSLIREEFLYELRSPVHIYGLQMTVPKKTIAAASGICTNWMCCRDGDTIETEGDMGFPEYEFDPNVIY